MIKEEIGRDVVAMNLTKEPPIRMMPEANGIEAMRKRPGLYVGSIDELGVYRLILGLVESIIDDNRKLKTTIHINLAACGSIMVEYDMTLIDWFELEVIKALSEVCEIHAHQEVNVYHQGVLVSQRPVETECSLDQIKIIFKPDGTIFTYNMLDYYVLFQRVKELVYLNPHVTVLLENSENRNRICFELGLEALLCESRDELDLLGKAQILNLHFVEKEIDVTVSMGIKFDVDVRLSYVNNIRTYRGGTHVAGLYDGVHDVVNKHLKDRDQIDKSHVIEKLNFVIHVKMANPQFMGCVKRELGNVEVRDAVKNGILRHLDAKLVADDDFVKSFEHYVTYEWLYK